MSKLLSPLTCPLSKSEELSDELQEGFTLMSKPEIFKDCVSLLDGHVLLSSDFASSSPNQPLPSPEKSSSCP